MPAENDPVRRPPEMVTLAEIARRVGRSKQRISQLARTDPDWPVPESEWQQVGRYYFLPWEPVKAYFDRREPKVGVHFKRDKPPTE